MHHKDGGIRFIVHRPHEYEWDLQSNLSEPTWCKEPVRHESLWAFYAAIGYDHKRNKLRDE